MPTDTKSSELNNGSLPNTANKTVLPLQPHVASENLEIDSMAEYSGKVMGPDAAVKAFRETMVQAQKDFELMSKAIRQRERANQLPFPSTYPPGSLKMPSGVLLSSSLMSASGSPVNPSSSPQSSAPTAAPASVKDLLEELSRCVPQQNSPSRSATIRKAIELISSRVVVNGGRCSNCDSVQSLPGIVAGVNEYETARCDHPFHRQVRFVSEQIEIEHGVLVEQLRHLTADYMELLDVNEQFKRACTRADTMYTDLLALIMPAARDGEKALEAVRRLVRSNNLPNLGLATNRNLIEELSVRYEMNNTAADYATAKVR